MVGSPPRFIEHDRERPLDTALRYSPAVLVWFVAFGCATVAARPVSNGPMPPPRPPELGGTQPGTAAPPPEPAVVAPAPASGAPAASGPPAVSGATPPTTLPRSECLAGLAGRGIVAELAAPPRASDAACAIEDPVRLTRILVEGAPNGAVLLPETPVVACRFAQSFGGWVGGLVAPLLAGKLGAPLAAIRTGPGFECRSRNHLQGAKLSAHASGIAIDIAAFELADKRVLSIKPGREPSGAPAPSSPAGDAAMAALRTAACGWFTTVLGPGSDPFHSDHLHLDVQPHGSSDRYRICQ